jgi:hypothetical protein
MNGAPPAPSRAAPSSVKPRLEYCVRVAGSKRSASSLNGSSDSVIELKRRVLWNSSVVQFRTPDWWARRCRAVIGHGFSGKPGT